MIFLIEYCKDIDTGMFQFFTVFCNKRYLGYQGANLGNTKTSEDKVRQQYESLPYPGLSNQTLFAEANHYSKHESPYMEAHSIRLEKLNHYLYGRNYSFR